MGKALDLRLETVARARIDSRRAGLNGCRCLPVSITRDARASVRASHRLPFGVRGGRGLGENRRHRRGAHETRIPDDLSYRLQGEVPPERCDLSVPQRMIRKQLFPSRLP